MAENGRPVNLEELGAGAVRKRIESGIDTVLVPLGGLEQHGNPFTPVGLDGIIVRALVERAARKADVIHTPLMPFGWTPMHLGEPGGGSGAVTLRSETFRLVMEDTARSLIYQGFDKVVFATLHGPNGEISDDVLHGVRYETGAFVALYGGRESAVINEIFDSPPARLSSDMECSLAMSLVGGFEGEHYLERAYDIRAPDWLGERLTKTSGMGSMLTFEGASNVHAGLDDSDYTRKAVERPEPSQATAERGEALLDSLSDHLARFAEHLKEIEVEVHSRDWPRRAR